MNEYDRVFDMLHYHLETVDCQCINALMKESVEYIETYSELEEILRLPWFNDFLNDKLTEPITVEQTKTILKFMNLNDLMAYDLRVMYYIHGMKDAAMLENIFNQLNDKVHSHLE